MAGHPPGRIKANRAPLLMQYCRLGYRLQPSGCFSIQLCLLRLRGDRPAPAPLRSAPTCLASHRGNEEVRWQMQGGEPAHPLLPSKQGQQQLGSKAQEQRARLNSCCYQGALAQRCRCSLSPAPCALLLTLLSCTEIFRAFL